MWLSDAIWGHVIWSSLVQAMVGCLFGAMSLAEPMLTYSHLDPQQQIPVKFETKYNVFLVKKIHLKIVFCKMSAILLICECINAWFNPLSLQVSEHGHTAQGQVIMNFHSNLWTEHDDVREMKIFSMLLGLCEGNHQSPVDSPHRVNEEIWCFLWCVLKQNAEQTVERQVN